MSVRQSRPVRERHDHPSDLTVYPSRGRRDNGLRLPYETVTVLGLTRGHQGSRIVVLPLIIVGDSCCRGDRSRTPTGSSGGEDASARRPQSMTAAQCRSVVTLLGASRASRLRGISRPRSLHQRNRVAPKGSSDCVGMGATRSKLAASQSATVTSSPSMISASTYSPATSLAFSGRMEQENDNDANDHGP